MRNAQGVRKSALPLQVMACLLTWRSTLTCMASSPISGRSKAVQLGADLREHRKRVHGGKGMTVTQVAAALGFHHSTVSRWERGEAMPNEADTAAVLAIYGVTGEERDRLVELARHDDVADWVAPGIGKQLAALIEYERIAERITEVNPLLIPGLLQTREYARSLMIGAGAPVGQAEQGAVIRLGRQHVLTRHKPVMYSAVIGEQAIRYPACDNDVMVGQLYNLLSISERPNVEIRILPLERRQYSVALEGRFILLEFLYDKPIVQVESYWSTSMLTNARAVSGYQDAVDAIRRDAMSAEASIDCIARIVKDMETSA